METSDIMEIIEENESFEEPEELEEPEEIGESEEPAETPKVDEELEAESRIEALKAEIASLEGELEQKRAETDRKAKEYAEFKELYPQVDPSELAPEVLRSLENGVPLAAAYALYEKKLEARASTAKAHNKATREGGFGSVGKGVEGEFYTPDEVRAMTRSEVRQNYQKILRSMRNWQ